MLQLQRGKHICFEIYEKGSSDPEYLTVITRSEWMGEHISFVTSVRFLQGQKYKSKFQSIRTSFI